MNVARQLFNLQEIDQELSSSQQSYARLTARLGENENVINTRNEIVNEKKKLEETTHQQHTVEWEIDDISTKLVKFEEELYSGRTTNPKELTSLQQEIDSLKSKRSKLEDKVLEIMEAVEQLASSVSNNETRLTQLESEWIVEQKEIKDELTTLESLMSELKEKRESLAGEFEPQVMEIYRELKRQRGTPVAKVEQGICRGCRISLPVSELQHVRSGGLVRCSSCGRILFLA